MKKYIIITAYKYDIKYFPFAISASSYFKMAVEFHISRGITMILWYFMKLRNCYIKSSKFTYV